MTTSARGLHLLSRRRGGALPLPYVTTKNVHSHKRADVVIGPYRALYNAFAAPS